MTRMQRRRLAALGHALLVIMMTGIIVAACVMIPTAPVVPKGHEGVALPTAKPGPFPHGKPSAHPVWRPVEPECTTPEQAASDVIKAAPDSEVYRHWVGPQAYQFIDGFNHHAAARVRADEVVIVTANRFGDLGVVVFATKGCAQQYAVVDLKALDLGAGAD